MKKALFTAALWVCFLIATPLTSYSKGKGVTCRRDSQCDFGLVCKNNKCVTNKDINFSAETDDRNDSKCKKTKSLKNNTMTDPCSDD